MQFSPGSLEKGLQLVTGGWLQTALGSLPQDPLHLAWSGKHARARDGEGQQDTSHSLLEPSCSGDLPLLSPYAFHEKQTLGAVQAQGEATERILPGRWSLAAVSKAAYYKRGETHGENAATTKMDKTNTQYCPVQWKCHRVRSIPRMLPTGTSLWLSNNHPAAKRKLKASWRGRYGDEINKVWANCKETEKRKNSEEEKVRAPGERKLREKFLFLNWVNSQDAKKRAGREVKDAEQRDYVIKEGSRTSGEAWAQTEREGWQEREHPLLLPRRKAGHLRDAGGSCPWPLPPLRSMGQYSTSQGVGINVLSCLLDRCYWANNARWSPQFQTSLFLRWIIYHSKH